MIHDPDCCAWIQERDDGDAWSTSCGNAMCINDGTPSENHWKFCCYCGFRIKEFPFVDDEEE